MSTHSYGRGEGLENDIYGGWRGDVAPGWQLDAGLLHYRYPGARLATPDGGSKRFDTTEAYLGATHGGLNVKWSLALTPYFGLRESTAGSAFATALAPAGSSRGSQYLDLNYQHPLGDCHAGRAWRLYPGAQLRRGFLRRLACVSGQDLGAWTASAAWAGTSADARYYSAANSEGRLRSLGRSGLVLGLSAGF